MKLKELIGVIAGAALAVTSMNLFADARIELGTAAGNGGNCHIPWDPNNADNEYKASCEIFLRQHEDGTYSGQAMGHLGRLDEVMVEGVIPWLYEPISAGNREYLVQNTCEAAQGVIQNDDGDAFTSNDCTIFIRFWQDGRTKAIRVRYDVTIRNAQPAAAAVSAEAALPMGKAPAFR